MIDYIFIVPYRDRECHKVHFLRYMEYILEDYDKNTYEILLIHQKDKRPFNRGAIKNMGFIYAKNKYKNYKDINFIFNDIDTIPCIKNCFNYNTTKGTVKHLYGFKQTLGGIFSIKGEDFEKVNGFPNYWTWGFEDNSIFYRCEDNKLIIDTSEFVNYGDMRVFQSIDSLTKATKKKRVHINELKNDKNGLNDLQNYNYKYNEEDKMVDIEYFDCGLEIPKVVEFIDVTNPISKLNKLKNNNTYAMKFV